jgi:hypothetical protein
MTSICAHTVRDPWPLRKYNLVANKSDGIHRLYVSKRIMHQVSTGQLLRCHLSKTGYGATLRTSHPQLVYFAERKQQARGLARQ